MNSPWSSTPLIRKPRNQSKTPPLVARSQPAENPAKPRGCPNRKSGRLRPDGGCAAANGSASGPAAANAAPPGVPTSGTDGWAPAIGAATARQAASTNRTAGVGAIILLSIGWTILDVAIGECSSLLLHQSYHRGTQGQARERRRGSATAMLLLRGLQRAPSASGGRHDAVAKPAMAFRRPPCSVRRRRRVPGCLPGVYTPVRCRGHRAGCLVQKSTSIDSLTVRPLR